MAEKPDPTPTHFTPKGGDYEALPERRISRSTCQKFGYRVMQDSGGKTVHVCDYLDDSNRLAYQKVRKTEEKGFYSNPAKAEQNLLFGGHLWRQGGKQIVITEGELDAMSIAEVQECKWPVVSIPSGVQGAAKVIKANLEFLNSFDKVLFCFDNDDAGRTAAVECADIIRPGKAYIVQLPLKDASDMLVARNLSGLNNALWQAKPYSPAGIVAATEIPNTYGNAYEAWLYPWDTLSRYLIGQRPGEITLWTSGTGSGKSTLIRELTHQHVKDGRKVGMVMLEESPEETLNDMISLELNKPVRNILGMRRLNELFIKAGKTPESFIDTLTDEEYNRARAAIEANDGLYVLDAQGFSDSDALLSRVEFFATGLNCQVVVLDHVTAAVAGAGTHGASEREVIDELMKRLRSVVERTGIHLHIVSQLRKSSGRGYEEGERVTLQDLRGSGSLASVPNTVIALERNRQSPDEEIASTAVLRVLKNRFNGRTGVASALRFNPLTGRYYEIEFTFAEDGRPIYGEPIND